MPTSKTDSSETTTWVSSASVAAVVTVLCLVGDCFASQLRLVLVKIRPSQISVNAEISSKTEVLYVSFGPTLPAKFLTPFLIKDRAK